MREQEKTSPIETFKKSVKSLFANYCRERMVETIKRGMLHRATSGYAITRPPLGYSTTETPGLYQLDSNGHSARSALQPLANGEANLGTVVAYLEMFYHVMTGIEHSGATWIESIVSNPYYCGYISYNGQLFVGLHEPLITVDEQRTIVEILNKHNKNNSLEPFDKALQSH